MENAKVFMDEKADPVLLADIGNCIFLKIYGGKLDDTLQSLR